MRIAEGYGRGCAVWARLLVWACLLPGEQALAGAEPAATTQPTAPAWMAGEPTRWPQILLSNDIRLKPNAQILGASGFLMRLPNGAVVAVTAKHLIDPVVKLDQLDVSLISWTMCPGLSPQRQVTLGRLAMKAHESAALDCLLMSVTPMASWPVEVRPARLAPVEVGQTVYLLAVPEEEKDKTSQKVYKGVVYRRGEKEFYFAFDGAVKTRGFSGAPILDTEGNVAGMCVGHVNNPPAGKTAIWSVDISAAVAAAQVPTPPSLPSHPSMTVPAPGNGPVAAPAADTAAAKASKALDMAKSLLTLHRNDAARSRLETIVQTYPDTPAAKEAITLLQQMNGQ